MSEDRSDRKGRQEQIDAVYRGFPRSEQQRTRQEATSAAETCAWKRLQRQRRELAEWLIDQVTDMSGRLIQSPIDACLGGDDYVPCSFSFVSGGRRFRFDLVSTAYTVVEVDDIG